MPERNDGAPSGGAVAVGGDRALAPATELCTVDVVAVPAGAVVTLSGELCYTSSPAVRRRLLEVVAGGPIRRLDLSRLTFIDLSGIDALGDVLDKSGGIHAPDVRLGRCARWLVELLTPAAQPAHAGPGAADRRSDRDALRAVACVRG